MGKVYLALLIYRTSLSFVQCNIFINNDHFFFWFQSWISTLVSISLVFHAYMFQFFRGINVHSVSKWTFKKVIWMINFIINELYFFFKGGFYLFGLKIPVSSFLFYSFFFIFFESLLCVNCWIREIPIPYNHVCSLNVTPRCTSQKTVLCMRSSTLDIYCVSKPYRKINLKTISKYVSKPCRKIPHVEKHSRNRIFQTEGLFFSRIIQQI